MKTTVIKITKMWLMVVAVSIFFIACGKDDEPVIPKSTEAAITSLSFSSAENNMLYQDVTAQVDESTKTITATVRVIVPQTDLNKQLSLVPTINFSNKATILPASNTAITVGGTTSPVNYTVTAEDGTTTQNYTLTTTVKYINQTATEVVATSHLATLYAIKENNPSATGFVANLDLDNASRDEIRASIQNRVYLNANKEIEQLNLYASNLDVLPAEIGNLTTLTRLDLGRNKLTQLPEEIGNLTNLNHAIFNYNKLQNLPSSFKNLTNLTILEFSNNDFEIVPAEILNLTTLENLSFYKNSLNELPSGIGNLTGLTTLSLSDNDLEGFPAEIGNLTALKTLAVATNNLKPAGLPDQMSNMTALTRVILTGNSKLVNSPNDLSSVVCNFLKGIRDTGGTVQTDLSLNCN